MKEKIKSPMIWALIIGLLCCFLIWRALNKPVEVVETSQTIAETVAGVQIAGDKAGVKLDKGQAYEVAQVIKKVRLENTEPAYVVNTNGKDVKKESQQAKEDSKADFSIVVNKDNPDEKVSLDGFSKDQQITLQQYNVKAYKKVIRTIDYSTNHQATFTISRKINNNGAYLGVGAGYDWENNRVIAKVSYSW